MYSNLSDFMQEGTCGRKFPDICVTKRLSFMFTSRLSSLDPQKGQVNKGLKLLQDHGKLQLSLEFLEKENILLTFCNL